MKKILFMCVANSARSQLAEGLARHIFGAEVEVESAGSHPGSLNPFAVQAMKEIGIDISRQYSKSYEHLPAKFLADLDSIVTLCAEEVCPVLGSHAKKIHWPFPDPAGKGGSDEQQLQRFRETRDAIAERLRESVFELGLKNYNANNWQ
jgi:arsenate reductase (thioredoxin)